MVHQRDRTWQVWAVSEATENHGQNHQPEDGRQKQQGRRSWSFCTDFMWNIHKWDLTFQTGFFRLVMLLCRGLDQEKKRSEGGKAETIGLIARMQILRAERWFTLKEAAHAELVESIRALVTCMKLLRLMLQILLWSGNGSSHATESKSTCGVEVTSTPI